MSGVPESMQSAHSKLVSSWERRAAAYKDLNAAYQRADLNAANTAFSTLLAESKNEAQFFDTLDRETLILELPLFGAPATIEREP
jgi:hypothetical protein